MKRIVCILIALVLCCSLAACSDSGNKAASKSNDKIDLVFRAIDTTPKGGDKVSFRAENTTDDTFTLKAIKVIAYDKDLNSIKVTGTNRSDKLKPGEKSRKFNFTTNGKPAMIKVVGYEYTQNGKTHVDKFDRNIISHGGTFSEIYGSYTDKQLLDKAY
jgi:uncharacterized lipoprotein YehR (DUF1307 family)